MAREPPAVFPQQHLLETHLLKEEFAPQNEVASIYLKGGITVTTSPFVVGEAQAAKWNSLICTFQQCHGCNPAHLLSYCQTNQPKVLGIFLQNITIHKKQGKKKWSISKVCFSTRHLLLEAQLGFFFLPFEKVPSQFQLTLKHHLLSNFAKHLDVHFRMLRCFISVLRRKIQRSWLRRREK